MALKGYKKGVFEKKDVINDEFFVYDNIFIHTGKFLFVILDGKCGIIERDTWKEVVPCKYKGVSSTGSHINGQCYILQTNTGKWIYLNIETLKELWPCNEPNVHSYLSESNVAVIYKDKKFVLIDKKGNPIQSYTNLILCQTILFVQNQFNKWSILDRTTLKEINHLVYDDVKYIAGTYFYFVLRSGKYGIIDSRSRSEIIPCKYDTFKDTKDGMIPVCLDDKWGFLDRDTLEEKIPCIYQDVSKFYGNYAAVKQRGKWGAINIKGDKVILSKFRNVLPSPSGLFCVWEDNTAIGKIIDSKGCVKYHTCNKYEDLVTSYSGLLTFYTPGTGIDGVYNIKEGKEIINGYEYCYCGRWGDGIKVKKGGKWGVRDNKGNLLIPCRFDDMGVYDSNGCWVKLNGKIGYYDGGEKVPCIYDSVERLAKNFYRVNVENKTLYYNVLTQEKIKNFDYKIPAYGMGFNIGSILIIEKDDKFGLFSLREMKEIIPCQCDEFKVSTSLTYSYTSYIVALKKNGKWGLFNFEGKPIIIKHTVEKDKPSDIHPTKAKQEKSISKTSQENTKSTEIDTLISAALIDGELSDKERKVLMKKAKLAGLDPDEFEILLNAKLYEIQSKTKKKTGKLKEVKNDKTKKMSAINKEPKTRETTKITKRIAKEEKKSVTKVTKSAKSKK